MLLVPMTGVAGYALSDRWQEKPQLCDHARAIWAKLEGEEEVCGDRSN